MQESITIRPMRADEAVDVARYHCEGIPEGVLAELGQKFLTLLYDTIAESADAFVFVAVDGSDHVVGFVCGSMSVGRTYRSVVLRRGWRLFWPIARYMLSLRIIRRVFESLLYPRRLPSGLPEAELLSIVVDRVVRGSGVASALLRALVTEFERRGCPFFKVMVRGDFERANAYYAKHGFELAATMDCHGIPSNIYTLRTTLEWTAA